MKKIIKSIPVYLTVVMILCCSLAVPAFASSGTQVPVEMIKGYHMPNDVYDDSNWYIYTYALPVGQYYIYHEYQESHVPTDIPVEHRTGPVLVVNPLTFEAQFYKSDEFLSGAVLTITEDMCFTENSGEFASLSGTCLVLVQSFSVAPSVQEFIPPRNGVYYQAFDMFAGFIYGEGVELTAEQNMVLTILATTAVLFVIVVPFLIVFFVLRLFR